MNVPELNKLYEVRQTFGAFGCGCKETFKTQPETEAYGRVIAGGLAGIFYHRAGNYADIPYRYPRCKNPCRYTAFRIRLFKDSGAYSDTDGRGRRIRFRGKMKWTELVNRIYRDVIVIRPNTIRKR